MTTQLCQHGCGQVATYTTKGSLKGGPFDGAPVHQCAKSHNACPAIKAKKEATSLKNFGTKYPQQNKEHMAKICQTNIEKYGHACSLKNPEQQAKRKKTMMDRYGVEEPTLDPIIRAKAAIACKAALAADPKIDIQRIKTRRERHGDDLQSIAKKCQATRVANGDWVDPSSRSEWEKYKRKVEYHTYRNYRKLKDLINPDGFVLGRRTYQLDHIYSRKAGFENGIDPKVIAHPANLRVMVAQENRLKQARCDHTIEELQQKIGEWVALLDSIDRI